MILNKTVSIFLLFIFFAFTHTEAEAQNRVVQDYSQLMEIPDVIAMEASPSHLYILSETKGLSVFRAYEDSLQWLYTSEGMQQRGDNILADIRFAYLFGNSRRLTVLEPTSVLGVYSSTILPDNPLAAARVDNKLFITMEDSGLGFISLESPESVDSDFQYVDLPELKNVEVRDIKTSITGRQLFVLTDGPALFMYNFEDGNLILDTQLRLRVPLVSLFIDDDNLWGSTLSGEVFELRSSGVGNRIGKINEPVTDVISWNNRFFARGNSGKAWIMNSNGHSELWKKDESAGNFLVDSEHQFWISENNNITEVTIETESENQQQSTGIFKLKPIPHQVLSYPEPLLLSLELTKDYTASEVEFTSRSSTKNAKIRKNGFYWQPTVNQIGTHWFKIQASSSDGASDSTRFTVEVRSFNTPPHFSPVRAASIAVDETYEINYHAIDPEYPQSSLIRYIGVDLPMGSNLNERTGKFTWKPNNRQIGETTFRIIATDKLGAAASMDVTLRVLDIARGN